MMVGALVWRLLRLDRDGFSANLGIFALFPVNAVPGECVIHIWHKQSKMKPYTKCLGCLQDHDITLNLSQNSPQKR